MSEPQRLEIHTHSTVSDGAYSPSRVAELAAGHGVELWALTDHDNVTGCTEAAEEARRRGMEFIPGVEISARLDGASIHVLGYGFDPQNQRLAEYGEEMTEARTDRMHKMIERMNELGYEVNFDDVRQIAGQGNVGRPHLARALLKRGYVDDLQEAFDRWLEDEGPGYVALARPSVEDAAEMIIDAGGLVVLAHPGRYPDFTDHLEDWKQAGLWGMEVRHPSHAEVDEGRLLRLADEHDLGVTASNDWHGNEPGDIDILGTVEFPDEWRREFLRAIDETAAGRQS